MPYYTHKSARTIPNIMPPAKATEGKRKERKPPGGRIQAAPELLLEEQIALFSYQNESLNDHLEKYKQLLEEHRRVIEAQRGVGGAEGGPSLPKLEAGGPKNKQRKPTVASHAKIDAKQRKRKEAEASPHKPNENEAHCARRASIVLAVFFKALYDKADIGPEVGTHEQRADSIQANRQSFDRFGCKKPEEVDEFADLVS